MKIALAGVLTYLWAVSVGPLMRTIFIWSWVTMRTIPTEPFQTVALGTPAIVGAALVAALVRQLLEWITGRFSKPERPSVIRQSLASAPAARALTEWIHPWVRVPLKAAWATLMLSGLMDDQRTGAVVFGVLLLLIGGREGIIPIP
jgi:hypothetical protein